MFAFNALRHVEKSSSSSSLLLSSLFVAIIFPWIYVYNIYNSSKAYLSVEKRISGRVVKLVVVIVENEEEE